MRTSSWRGSTNGCKRKSRGCARNWKPRNVPPDAKPPRSPVVFPRVSPKLPGVSLVRPMARTTGGRYRDLFVHTIRDRPPVVRAMGRTRLTPGSFGLTLGKTTGERGGLAAGGTLRGFQFLAQPLDFLLQLPILFLQLLVSSAGLVAFLPRTAVAPSPVLACGGPD